MPPPRVAEVQFPYPSRQEADDQREKKILINVLELLAIDYSFKSFEEDVWKHAKILTYNMCAVSHASSCMLVNHGPSQQSSKEEYKPPFSNAVYPLHRKLQLVACCLSGKPSKSKVFQKKLMRSCVHHGDSKPSSSIQCICPGGVCSAVNRVIPCMHL